MATQNEAIQWDHHERKQQFEGKNRFFFLFFPPCYYKRPIAHQKKE